MAIANFFDKVTLGLSQILKNLDTSKLNDFLESKCIGIFYDENAITSKEGRYTLDMIVRLLSRLYPIISIQSHVENDFSINLTKLAQSINPEIEIQKNCLPTICICVGKTYYPEDVPCIFIGSNNWIVNFSVSHPVGSGNSKNPFAAGVCACVGAANIFRYIFKDLINDGRIDDDFSLSLLDYKLGSNLNELSLDSININETILVGVGAIGNSVIWGLQKLENAKGELIVIDNQKVSLTNLQRYVLAIQDHINEDKTVVFGSKQRTWGIKFLSEQSNWEDYIIKRKNWDITTVLTCVDSSEDRITIQGSLPKYIFNAWTQQENLGVSRHLNFLVFPCLACLYYPTEAGISRSQEVADNLNIPEKEREVRTYLANNLLIDEAFLTLVCNSNQSLNFEELKSYIGKSMDIFYSEIVCGRVIIKSKDVHHSDIDVPCAFESAMAGLLLATELIKFKLGLQVDNYANSIRFNLLRPLTKYIETPEVKKANCFCNDEIYRKVYLNKWTNKIHKCDFNPSSC